MFPAPFGLTRILWGIGEMITSKLVLVTPEMAREWLAKNLINRPIATAQVARLVEIIKAGKWEITPDSIGFNVYDQLTNGQHRLAAIVQAGIPVRLMVVTGLPVESFAATDQGRVRSVSDAIKEDKHLVAVANFILKFTWQSRSKPANHCVKTFCDHIRPFYHEVMAAVGVMCAGNGNPRGYCRTQIIAAGIIALVESKLGITKAPEEYILERMASWFNGDNPSKINVILMTHLGERRNRVDLNSVFLKAFHLFDPNSQEYSKLYCRNHAQTRALIPELLDIPPFLSNLNGARLRVDPTTGDKIPAKKRGPKAAG